MKKKIAYQPLEEHKYHLDFWKIADQLNMKDIFSNSEHPRINFAQKQRLQPD